MHSDFSLNNCTLAGRPGDSVGNPETSQVGTRVRISAQSQKRVFFSHYSQQVENDYVGYTKVDFKVDEAKERLNPSRDKILRQAPQKEGGEKKTAVRPSSCVTPANASTYFTERCSLTSRINGMLLLLSSH